MAPLDTHLVDHPGPWVPAECYGLNLLIDCWAKPGVRHRDVKNEEATQLGWGPTPLETEMGAQESG